MMPNSDGLVERNARQNTRPSAVIRAEEKVLSSHEMCVAKPRRTAAA